MMKHAMRGFAVVMVLGLCGLNACAVRGQERENTQTKVGVVKKVDLTGKKIVVMVARELTFTVTENTKIHQGGKAKALDDIKVGANVKVEYTRAGDIRTATDIAILATEKKSEGTQTKVGVVKNVDVEGKKIVVMVARELTFTVTENTKIRRGDAAKKLSDINAGTNVKVEYTRTGDKRIATNIAILSDDEKK